jgi:hypothetical protein
MRTAAIKIKSFVAVAQDLPRSTRAELFKIAVASLAMLAVVYFFILGAMVWNIIERKGTEAQMHLVASEVHTLEEKYLEQSSKVDINFSHAMGFREIKATYTRKNSLGLAAKRNEI